MLNAAVAGKSPAPFSLLSAIPFANLAGAPLRGTPLRLRGTPAKAALAQDCSGHSVVEPGAAQTSPPPAEDNPAGAMSRRGTAAVPWKAEPPVHFPEGTPTQARGTPGRKGLTPSFLRSLPTVARGTPAVRLGTPAVPRGTPAVTRGVPAVARGTPAITRVTPEQSKVRDIHVAQSTAGT